MLIVALVINFKFESEPVSKPKAEVKKEVVIKKVYIRVPMPADSIKGDSTIITLPKQPLANPAPSMRKYRRTRNLHRPGFIS